MVVLRKVMVASLVQCTASMALLQIRITLVPLVQHTAFMALLNIRPTWKPPKKPVGAAANKRWLAGQMGADWIGDRAGKNWQRGVDGLGGRRSEHLARVISRTKAQDGEGDGSNDRWQALMATAVCRAIPTPSARFSQVLREI